LELYYLGPLEIRSDGHPRLIPPTLKSQSLLAYLVCHRSQPQPRDRLAGLFYGEWPERKAQRCLPDETVLTNDSYSEQFDPCNNVWLNHDEFEAHASWTDTVGLQAAVALNRGDFLDGFYDDWILSERYRLEAVFLETLARLLAIYEARRDYQAALATALLLLGRDPLREDTQCTAMCTYCHLVQQKAALEHYIRCRQTLLEELNTQPISSS
jgi:DNA-binding SARP family transcriptional activator